MGKEKQCQSDTFAQLKAALKEKKLERLYIFHGEESFLMRHYVKQIYKTLIDPVTESFNYHKLTTENFSVVEFANSVENLPMMAENTLVLLDEIEFFRFPEDEREKMQDILSDIPPYCTVVFTYETTKWSPDKRMKKLWEAVDKNGQIVEFAKQSERDLIPWIGRHFAAHQKRIPNDLCAYLITLTGGTMTALATEIRKIAAYSAADIIVKSDIEAVVEPVLDAVVFQMTESFCNGEYGKALVQLSKLRKMQEEPLNILGAIGSHFRRLATAKVLANHGKNASDLRKLYPGLPEFLCGKSMSQCKRFSERFYEKAATLIMETDNRIKTSYDNPDRLLEQLLLELSQEARNG